MSGSRKKILAVCQYYYPENFQITPICEQLARDGYDVTVLTGLPNYPEGVVPEKYKKGRRKEKINGVKIVRCNETGRGKGMIRLAVNYASFTLDAVAKAGRLRPDYDLVFVYQLSPVLMGLPGLRYAKKNGVPLLLYCCDLWPESLKMYIHDERNPVFRAVKWLSRKIYASADLVVGQSASFLPYLRDIHGLEDDRLAYLPAFADESYLLQDFTPDGSTVDFVFLGNLGIAQNLDTVLEAVNKIRHIPGFKVHFVGDGACFDTMKKFVKNKGLQDKVLFYGRRPVEEMPRFYKLADACLVSLKADDATGLTLPSKIQGYMAAGKPVIGMINGSAKDVIEESGCGICVGAGDVDGFAHAMRSFIEDGVRYRSCGGNGRNYFRKNFSREKIMLRLENMIDSLLEKDGK